MFNKVIYLTSSFRQTVKKVRSIQYYHDYIKISYKCRWNHHTICLENCRMLLTKTVYSIAISPTEHTAIQRFKPVTKNIEITTQNSWKFMVAFQLRENP